MTTEARPISMGDRLNQFKRDCPGAGTEFPAVSSTYLDGVDWRIADFRGRVVVLETGSFT